MNTDLLLEPQKEHAKVLMDSLYINGFAVDTSQMGTGKTYVAAAIAREINVPIVVICPRVAISIWNNVLSKFGIKPHVVINYEKLCRGNTKWMKYKRKEFFKRKNWESKGIYLHFPKDALIILDEAHKCCGKDSLQSYLMVAIKNARYKFLHSSGTYATTVLDMKAIGYSLNLHGGHDFSKWARDHGAESALYGRLKTTNKARALEGMKRIHKYMFEDLKCASRLTPENFVGTFPANHVSAICYDVGDNAPKIQGIYDDMQSELNRLDARAMNYSAHVFAVMMEARRKTELLKVPALVEMIEDIHDENVSPVVFLNFKDSIEAVINRLNRNSKFHGQIALLTGSQTEKEKESDIAEFQDNIKTVLLANLAAGSMCVSLQDLTGDRPRSSVLCPSFFSRMVLQAFGRIPRSGGKTPCYQRMFFAAKTIEEQACERCQDKTNNLSTLNDGDLTAGIRFYGTL